MDRLDAIASFIAVVDAGGFSAAARQLGMPLATVSRKVAELEAHIGAQLLTRSTRRVAPTEAGAAFAATGRLLLEQLSEAERSVAGKYLSPRGLLRVAAPIVLGLAYLLPILADFMQAYPEVTLDLRLTQRPANLAEDHLDVAVMVGELPDSGLRAEHVGQIRLVVVASPGYLAAHQLIGHGEGEMASHWQFSSGRRLALRARLVVTTAEAAADAAVAGMGLAQLLCYQVYGAVADGRLTTLLRQDWGPPLDVHLKHGGDRIMPQKLRAFMAFVAPRLRPRLVFNP